MPAAISRCRIANSQPAERIASESMLFCPRWSVPVNPGKARMTNVAIGHQTRRSLMRQKHPPVNQARINTLSCVRRYATRGAMSANGAKEHGLRRRIERPADRRLAGIARGNIDHPTVEIVGVVRLRLRRFVGSWVPLVDDGALHGPMVEFAPVTRGHDAGHRPLPAKINERVAEIAVGPRFGGISGHPAGVVRIPRDRRVRKRRQRGGRPRYDVPRPGP